MKVIDILRKNNPDLNEILKNTLKKDIFQNSDQVLTKKEYNKYIYLKNKYIKKMPIEYIVKKAYFDKYEFFVNKNVLIPRIETSDILQYLNKYKNILDIGTGSGIVGISLKKNNPQLKITLSDISKKAIYVAKKNKGLLDIKIIQSDLISNIKNIDQFDCIFANLPYISNMKNLPYSVKNYEPAIALDGGENGIYLILKLIQEITETSWKGDLYLELDPNQIKYIKNQKEIIKDRFNKDRFIKIRFN